MSAQPEFPPSLSVTLPLPPTSNNSYYNTPLGRALTQEAKDWKEQAGWLTKLAMRDCILPPLPLALSFFVYFADHRRDLDNAIKLAQDSVCTTLAVNDRHVHELHVYRAIDKDNPRLIVVVRSVEG